MYFLCGVADVQLFSGDTLIGNAKTLIDSSITIGLTAEDIRAGQGAKLYGKYFHSSTFDLQLTNQAFDLAYIARNIGSTVEMGGEGLTDESVTLGEGGVGEVSLTPAAWDKENNIIGWARKVGTEDYKTITFNGKQFTIVGGVAGEVYCVKYTTYFDSARRVVVKANFIPDTIKAILTAKLYSGDASNPEAGTVVGTLDITVPRLCLSGSQELSMSMTGVSQTSLSGSALAVTDGASCDDEGYYAIITEHIDGANWYDNVDMLAVVDADFTMKTTDTKTLIVKAIYNNGTAPKTIDNAKLTFTAEDTAVATVGANTGVITPVAVGGTAITINVTEKPELEAVAYCTIEA